MQVPRRYREEAELFNAGAVFFQGFGMLPHTVPQGAYDAHPGYKDADAVQ